MPVQINKEAREATVELDAREGLVDYTVVHREAATDTGLEILVREHNTFENSVREVRVLSPLIECTYLTE